MRRLIVVVCRGNIGRSPFAEAIIRRELVKHGLAEKYEVLSRGIQGTTVDPGAVQFPNITYYKELYADSRPTLEKFNVDMSAHHSTMIDQLVTERASVLLAMDRKTLTGLQRLFPAQTTKMHLFSELAHEKQDIMDPEGVSGAAKQEQIFTRIWQLATANFPALLRLADS